MTPEIQRPSPPPELVERARAYIASTHGRFASMMADTRDHALTGGGWDLSLAFGRTKINSSDPPLARWQRVQ